MTTDYTDAPATDLLATRCAACGRPLLDAASVEAGMGPICRGRAGLDGAGTGAAWPAVVALLAGTGVELESDDARRTANRVTHRIAADQSAANVPVLLGALDALGFAGVAKAIRSDLDNAAMLTAVGKMIMPGRDTAPFIEELRERVVEEIDYSIEAANQQTWPATST